MNNTEWLGGEAQVWTQEFTFHSYLTHTAQMPFHVVFNASVWRDIGSDVGFSTCSLKSMLKNFGTLVTFGFSGGSVCMACIHQGHMENGEHLKRERMQSQVLIQRVKGRPLWMEGRGGGWFSTCVLLGFGFWDMVSLYSQGKPRTHGQSSTWVTQVQGLQVSVTTPSISYLCI